MNGFERFKLKSAEYVDKTGTPVRQIDLDAKPKDDKSVEELAAGAKESKEGTEENLDKEKKTDDLTEKQVLEQATVRAEEIGKVDEAKRTDEDKKFLESYKALKDTDVETSESTGFKDLIEDLTSNGILDTSEGKEYEDSRAGLVELLADNRDKVLSEFRKDLPPDVQAVLDYVVDNGGSLNDYMDVAGEADYEGVDLKDAYNQKVMVSTLMSRQGNSDADISKKIELYEDNGLLESESLSAQKVLTSDRDVRVQARVKQQQDIAEQAKEKIENKRTEFNSKIDTLETIDDIPVSKKDSLQLKTYMTRPVKDGKTQWQIDSLKVDSQIKQAFFTMKGFDMEKISKSQRSKMVSDLRNILSKSGDPNTKSIDSGISHPKESMRQGKEGETLIIPKMPWMNPVEVSE